MNDYKIETENTVPLGVRIRKDQNNFFKDHPLLNKSSVVRKAIDLYIEQLFNEDAYSEAEKMVKGGK